MNTQVSEKGMIFKVTPGSKQDSLANHTISSTSQTGKNVKGFKRRQLSRSELKFEGKMSDREAFLNNRKEAVNLIKFSKAGDLVLVGKVKGTLCVWKFEEQILEYKIRLHNGLIYIIELINNEKQVITCDDKGIVKISRIIGKFEVLRYLDNKCYINTGVFCHKKKILICTGEEKGGIKIWSFEKYLSDLELEHEQRNTVIEQTESDSQRPTSKKSSYYKSKSIKKSKSRRKEQTSMAKSKPLKKINTSETKDDLDDVSYQKRSKKSSQRDREIKKDKVVARNAKRAGRSASKKRSYKNLDYRKMYEEANEENIFFKKRVKKYESEVQNLREEKRNLLKQIYLLRREKSEYEASARSSTMKRQNS